LADRFRLRPQQLRWICDPARLGFQTTAELRDLTAPIGQDRAVEALEFGVRMPGDGYNILIVGHPGTGRASMARAVLDKVTPTLPTPCDWCYVHNFEDPNQPHALSLPAGMGCQFRQDMEEFVEDVRRELAAAFDSEEYSDRRDAALKAFREDRQAEFEAFEQEATAAGLVVGRGPAGFMVAPGKDGEVLSPQEYAELPAPERKLLDDSREALQDRLNEIVRRQQRKEKDARAQVKALNQEVAGYAVGHLVDELLARYGDYDGVPAHLDHLRSDIIEHADDLRAAEEEAPQLPIALPLPRAESPYARYRVNVLLSCEPRTGAPVVYESNPTIDNLTGQIEHRPQMGALLTDFTMIRPGALHRANGGFLLLDAEAVLTRPYAWEALKRALKNRQVKIESIADQLRFLTTATLEPEPIPLDVKVVLVGTPYTHYLLSNHDDEFRKLFKVKADFDTSTRRGPAVVKQLARFVATRCRQEGLPDFDAAAVALVIEHSARLAADQTRFTTRFIDVADLVREAAYWCRANSHHTVADDDVQRAIREHIRRSNRVEERLQEMVERDFIYVDLQGSAVGQINGLAVVAVGDYWFGRPSRITARTFVGRGGVTQIDREARLTGRIHDKGVLILSGFLGARYGRSRSLSLGASITFEQTYDTIDGDSASSTELYALLSSLGDLPLRQEIAVTGSVSQAGEIQPIGGVNEKIEGFYAACKLRGLTGTQGVLIPRANVPSLMLDPEVVQAAAAGTFHIYAVSKVDEGMEVLTGLKAGRLRKDGTYTPGSINARVQQALIRFTEAYDGKSTESTQDDDDAHTAEDQTNGARRTRPRARRR
jgi:lon-related putative ATP-dependent protease